MIGKQEDVRTDREEIITILWLEIAISALKLRDLAANRVVHLNSWKRHPKEESTSEHVPWKYLYQMKGKLRYGGGKMAGQDGLRYISFFFKYVNSVYICRWRSMPNMAANIR